MTVPTAPACATLSVEEAAAVLGVSCTKTYELVRSAMVPHVRFGRVIRIPRQSLDDWLLNRAAQSLRTTGEGSW